MLRVRGSIYRCTLKHTGHDLGVLFYGGEGVLFVLMSKDFAANQKNFKTLSGIIHYLKTGTEIC